MTWFFATVAGGGLGVGGRAAGVRPLCRAVILALCRQTRIRRVSRADFAPSSPLLIFFPIGHLRRQTRVWSRLSTATVSFPFRLFFQTLPFSNWAAVVAHAPPAEATQKVAKNFFGRFAMIIFPFFFLIGGGAFSWGRRRQKSTSRRRVLPFAWPTPRAAFVPFALQPSKINRFGAWHMSKITSNIANGLPLARLKAQCRQATFFLFKWKHARKKKRPARRRL
ncbi:hypothetical protein TW95_gp1805 [Pandoravirus inopinatum]|uniref:Uncharacterized protein n=1 Tax=Pandoravirus inopinatum TaxID=1605721 RepID=A0A0B5J4I7_9VIRU|nr:hypothetical protein TW95_gp1805 [Pandoravirus inopinatum]AJF98539.1 hypothetical protein [Pandoravirus inopinatum]